MFKEAFKSAIQVVFSTEPAWDAIDKKQTNLYKEFLIPLWSLIAIASFAGGWLVSQDGTIEIGIKNVISEVFVLFVSFNVSSFILNEYVKNLTDVECGLNRARIFVAYSSSLVYLINMVVSLVPDFFFLWLFALYTFYIVYLGAEIFYKITSQRKTNFMIIISLVVLFVPLFLRSCISAMVS